MCFSATASFVASGVLAGASIVTLTSVKKKSAWGFALIPFLFAVQQAVEGFQWLSLNQGVGSLPLAYLFLFFALMFWPIFLPSAALQAENDPKRRLLIKLCIGLGIFSASVFFSELLIYPLTVEVAGRCINYHIGAPDTLLFYPFGALYVTALVGGGFLVRKFWIQMFAALGLLGFVISYTMFSSGYASVWCFFAAVLSLCVIMELRSKPGKK